MGRQIRYESLFHLYLVHLPEPELNKKFSRGCTCSFYIRGSPSEAENIKISSRLPKNISKDCKILTSVARIFRHFKPGIIRLRNQYPLTQKYRTEPKVVDPKISDEHPRMFNIQVLPLGTVPTCPY